MFLISILVILLLIIIQILGIIVVKISQLSPLRASKNDFDIKSVIKKNDRY
ncbi:hypothetical protein HMPREF0554_1386 [Pseudoleptotrichia goodfellowii F0264]|uniref:Uncharacterized protein n=2 Tax=Pseudoleptotrichia goodfellowii TaxID=157692 RepID=D0GNB7_9FUSO|nr:hypothetical protein HMPREF0554_1386 [Pseudoleptotrichia goodfellowii F0264]MBF4805590.1 hypothetical protein [Pseudoleptotrichia goodfellowii]